MVVTMAQKQEKASTLRVQRRSVVDQLVNLESLMETYKASQQVSSAILALLTKRVETIEQKYFAIHNQILEVGEEVSLGNDFIEAKQIDLRFQAIQVEICKLSVAKVEPPSVSQPRLPDLKLVEFTGKYYDWDAFKDLFESLVHKRQDIDNVSKFRYLKGCLGTEAACLIAGLRVTQENYSSAWKILNEKFENRPLSISTLLGELLTMKPMENSSASEINRINLTTNTISVTLNNMNYQLDVLSSALIVEIISRKMTNKLREDWEAARPNEVADWKTLTVFLEKQVRIHEQVESHKKLTNDNAGEPSKTRNTRTFTTLNKICPVCRQHHRLHQCAKFKQMSTMNRSQVIMRFRLCLKCLDSREHQCKNCTSNNCKKCGRQHHTLMHRDSNKDLVVSDGPNNTQFEEAVNIGNEVLLPTATVYVLDKDNNKIPCRAIIDSASQSSFITSALVSRMKMKTKPINLESTGLNGTVTTQSSAKLKAYVQPLTQEGKKRLVEFNVIKNVTDDLPTRSLEVKHWNIPTNVNLADPKFHVSGSVDILLGTKVFFDVLQPGIQKLKNATMINTEFGWVIGGNCANESTVSMFTRSSKLNMKKQDKNKIESNEFEEWQANPNGSRVPYATDGYHSRSRISSQAMASTYRSNICKHSHGGRTF